MNTSTLEAVKDVIIETLGIEDRGRIELASTPLFGNIPELDSFAVLSLAAHKARKKLGSDPNFREIGV